MADLDFKDEVRTYEGGVRKLYGTLTIGASGAISSESSKGFSTVKTSGETGRYTITLSEKYVSFLGGTAAFVVAADAAVSGTVGVVGVFRNDAVQSAGTIDLQCLDMAGADANPTSGFIIKIALELKNTEAF